eukprot:COSAG01_NODE_53387_length_339_cov_1.300000_2_plen_56_part_01
MCVRTCERRDECSVGQLPELEETGVLSSETMVRRATAQQQQQQQPHIVHDLAPLQR